MIFSRRQFLAGAACITTSVHVAAKSLAQTAVRLDPSSLSLNHVTARNSSFGGRSALLLALEDARQKQLLQPGSGFGNGPTLALLPGEYSDFDLEVSVAAAVNGRGAPESRAFAGIAFRVTPDYSRFESIYLRMTNGTLANAPPPRNQRAIQYIAHPDFHFNVSREQAPGVYERAAPVAPEKWHRFRVQVRGAAAKAWVDGAEVLAISNLRSGERGQGKIGFFVDDGTDAYFADAILRN